MSLVFIAKGSNTAIYHLLSLYCFKWAAWFHYIFVAERILKYVKCDTYHLFVEEMHRSCCCLHISLFQTLEVSSFNNAHNWERLWSDLLTMINENSPCTICWDFVVLNAPFFFFFFAEETQITMCYSASMGQAAAAFETPI